MTSAPTLTLLPEAPHASRQIPRPDDFGGEDFVRAENLALIAAELIERHERLGFLSAWLPAIDFAWKHKGGEKGGKATFGRLQQLSGYARYKSGCRWLLWAAADHCRRALFDDRQVEALVFHELCHLERDVDPLTGLELGPPVLVGHDWEGFDAELEAYGAWRPSLQAAQLAFGQLPLPGVE